MTKNPRQRLEWSARAGADLAAIDVWYAQFGQRTSDRVVSSILTAAKGLQDHALLNTRGSGAASAASLFPALALIAIARLDRDPQSGATWSGRGLTFLNGSREGRGRIDPASARDLRGGTPARGGPIFSACWRD